MVIIRTPYEIDCLTLAEKLGGQLNLAAIAPLLGEHTLIQRISLEPDLCENGATYLHAGTSQTLLSKAARAYESGANGIICRDYLPPLAGGFTITIPSIEIVNGAQYPLISQLISGKSLHLDTAHRHHLRRSA